MAREIVTSENRDEYINKKLMEKREKTQDGDTLDNVSDKYKKDGVETDLMDTRQGIELSRIVVPKEKRGEGIGSEFMSDLISHADRKGKRIVLTPATDFGASSVARLKEFYKRHGFVENKGKNKDFSIRHAMYRMPVKKEGALDK